MHEDLAAKMTDLVPRNWRVRYSRSHSGPTEASAEPAEASWPGVLAGRRGGAPGARTQNPRIKSPLHCRCANAPHATLSLTCGFGLLAARRTWVSDLAASVVQQFVPGRGPSWPRNGGPGRPAAARSSFRSYLLLALRAAHGSDALPAPPAIRRGLPPAGRRRGTKERRPRRALGDDSESSAADPHRRRDTPRYGLPGRSSARTRTGAASAAVRSCG